MVEYFSMGCFPKDRKIVCGLDFPQNSADLDTYYYKIIDIQNTTIKQIQQIFHDV